MLGLSPSPLEGWRCEASLWDQTLPGLSLSLTSWAPTEKRLVLPGPQSPHLWSGTFTTCPSSLPGQSGRSYEFMKVSLHASRVPNTTVTLLSPFQGGLHTVVNQCSWVPFIRNQLEPSRHPRQSQLLLHFDWPPASCHTRSIPPPPPFAGSSLSPQVLRT